LKETIPVMKSELKYLYVLYVRERLSEKNLITKNLRTATDKIRNKKVTKNNLVNMRVPFIIWYCSYETKNKLKTVFERK
jgi:hypothetical protein